MADTSAGPNNSRRSNPGGPATASDAATDINEAAVNTLIRHGFVKKRDNDEFDVMKLAAVLTKINARVAALPNATALDESMRAVIILLHDVDEVSPETQVRMDAMATLKTQEERMASTITRMEEMLEKSTKHADGAGAKLDVISTAIQALESSAKETADKLTADAVRRAQGERGNVAGETGALSFAQAVASAPARHVDAVARIALIRRQVVLGRADDEGADPFKDSSEKDIVAKAHMAVELMAKDGLERAASIKFLHARKIGRGGAILVTTTEEDAAWLRQEGTMSMFAEKMGGAVSARADLCMLVAEYVPISFDPVPFTALGQVERDNGLEKGALREARYIKPTQFRKPTQRSAHMLMGFANPDQANMAIRRGLVIEGKKVSLRRHRVDPHRCMKCQQVGTAHRAAECKSIHDTCGRCAGMHRTAACEVTDAAAFRCVTCNKMGHATVDRNCPKFIEKMRATHARFPDYQYRFFPTQDAATWELEDYGLNAGGESGGSGERSDADRHGNRPGGARAQNAPEGRGPITTRARDNGWVGVRNAKERGAGGSRGEPSTLGSATLHQTTLDDMVRRSGPGLDMDYPREEERGRDAWGDTPAGGRNDPMNGSQSSSGGLYA
jgi:hypothetical protein